MACAPVVVTVVMTFAHMRSTTQTPPTLAVCVTDARRTALTAPATAVGTVICPATGEVRTAPLRPPVGFAPIPLIPVLYQGVCGMPAAAAVAATFPKTCGIGMI